MLTFHIRGEPKPKGRPHFARRGKFVSAYTPAATRNAEADLRGQIISQLPANFSLATGPLRLEATFRRQRPKSARKGDIWPITRPDLDNYLKLVLDAMNSVVFIDDSQLVAITVVKSYGEPGIDIIIEEIEGKL
jgi:Holliday junction resolvase RusA-like endonuclease